MPEHGQRIGHYELLGELGKGGMGVVYRARDLTLGREVALKRPSPRRAADAHARRRFMREARAASRLSHPNIVPIYEVFEDDGTPWIAMQLVGGTSLSDLLDDQRVLPLRQVLQHAEELADALHAAHSQSLLHRDIKPDNIVLSADGRAMLTDFGLALYFVPQEESSQASTQSHSLTPTGVIVGTHGYMSPEQSLGHAVDARSDIFALGAVLYEMCTGRRAFTAPSSAELLDAVLHHEPVPISRLNYEVPEDLERIIRKCLSKTVEERYQDTRDLLVDLRAVRRRVEHQSYSKEHPAVREPARRSSRARWSVAFLGSIAVIVAVWWLIPRPPRPPTGIAGVALLPLSYEGSEDQAYLKDTIPLVLAEAIRSSAGLQVAPYATSRSFAPEEDPGAVARQLGVAWVVQGQVSIRSDQFEARIWTTRDTGGRRTWSGAIEGDIGSLLPRIDRLAGELLSALGSTASRASVPGTTRNPQALESYLRGRVLYEGWDVQKNYSRAEAAFRKAIELDARFAEAHAMLAEALALHYIETKQPELTRQAADAAERALALAPDLPEAQTAMGLVELTRGRSVEAARFFERGLEMAPADDSLCRQIARAYADLRRDEDAEKMFQRAIDLRPAYWNNYNAKGAFYLRRARLDQAKEMFRKVIELHPDAATGYSNLAVVLILAGEHKEAEPLLLAALRISPNHMTRNNLGVVYYATGRFEQAAEQWRKATEDGSQDVMLFSNLGDAYRQLGRHDDAGMAYGEAIQLGTARLQTDPADAEARAMLAIALAGVGRCDEARDSAKLAAEQASTNPTLSYYVAAAMAVCGDREGAIRYASRAIQGGALMDVRTNPDLKPLLVDPSIQRLLKQAP